MMRAFRGVFLVAVVAACGSPTPTQAPVSTATQPAPSTATPIAPATGAAGSAAPTPAGPATPRPTIEPRPTPAEGAFQFATVDSFGYTALQDEGNDVANWAAVITNPNTEWAVYRMLVQVNFFSADDSFVGGEEIQVTILPGQTTAIIGQTTGAGAAVRMLVALPEDPAPYLPFVSSGTIEVSELRSELLEAGLLTAGTLTSALTSDQTFLQLFAVYSDSSGELVGGTAGAVEAIQSGASVPFAISEVLPPSSWATTDVYWQLGGQLPRP